MAEASARWKLRNPLGPYLASKAAKQRLRGINQLLVDVRRAAPCSDCHTSFPACAMDWDHAPGTAKIDGIANMVRDRKPSVVMAELDKCELVCANCHRVRTRDRLCR